MHVRLEGRPTGLTTPASTLTPIIMPAQGSLSGIPALDQTALTGGWRSSNALMGLASLHPASAGPLNATISS